MWLRPQGFAEIVTPVEDVINLDHIRKEKIPPGQHRMDSCTCGHCNSVFHVSARMRPEDIGGLCHHCWRPICPKCLDKPCVPWEAQLEMLELEDKLKRKRNMEEWGI